MADTVSHWEIKLLMCCFEGYYCKLQWEKKQYMDAILTETCHVPGLFPKLAYADICISGLVINSREQNKIWAKPM